jgi:hypothetical protein
MLFTTEQIQQMREAREACEAICDLADHYSWETIAREMLFRMSGAEARSFLEHMEDFEAERYMRED